MVQRSWISVNLLLNKPGGCPWAFRRVAGKAAFLKRLRAPPHLLTYVPAYWL